MRFVSFFETIETKLYIFDKKNLMSCYTEYTVREFLTSKCQLRERIAAIDLLIDQALLSLADTVSGPSGNISSYELDDGQVRIKTGYRSVQDVRAGIASLESMRQLYINRLDGRAVVLQDKRTFR